MYDRIDVVYARLCDDSGNHHHCRYDCPVQHRCKMISALAAVLLEAFTQGAALAVSVYLLWKKKDHE